MHEVLERLRRELADGVEGLSAEETQVRPVAGKWCVQQIVEHLMLSYATTAMVFETRLAKGAGTKARPSLAQRTGQFVITRLGIFPRGRVAPAAVMPVETAERKLAGAELAVEVAAALTRMDGLMSRAEVMFGGAQAVSHLVLGPMSVGQWRLFHLVHGRHHLKQIATLRTQLR